MECIFPWMHKKNELVCLPVSTGEAIDKLTILNIKLQKITDSRKNDVQVEYDILKKKLESTVNELG